MSRIAHLVICLWLTGTSVSHAALFDDKEARKRITEVEAQSLANDQAQQKALEQLQQALEKRIATLEGLVSSQGLIELQNQIESLKQQVAQLKGENELLLHKLEETQTRQKQLYVDVDGRLKRFESGNNAPNPNVKNGESSTSQNITENEVKLLADAEAYTQVSQHKEAFNAYDMFLKTYPNSPKAPEALYGMGYSQFALRNYKSSIATQQKLIDAYPEHARAPEAMYNIANSQIQLAQISQAKKNLEALIQKYPNAEVTPSAQKRLKALEAIR